eukprot:gene19545-25443_t
MSIPSHDHPYLLSLPTLISAKKKLAKVAAFYDTKGRSSLKAFFETPYMNPTEFREQLKRNFLIQLTDEEL